MKNFKITVRNDGRAELDLSLRFAPAVTVGDAAQAIAVRAKQAPPSPGLTLGVYAANGAAQPLPASTQLNRSGLRSGLTVALMQDSGRYYDPGSNQQMAMLEVLEGPDAPAMVTLGLGTHTVGRDPACTVRLTDKLVSKLHARVTVADVIEIVDTNSANGVILGGGPVNRAVLRSDDTVLLGDSVIRVSRLGHGGAVAAMPGVAAGGEVEHNRSPRLDPTYEGRKHEAPQPPKPAARRHFPLIALLAPVLMGGVLFLVTQSVFSLAFLALSPLMLVGSYAESMFSDRRELRRATGEFRAALSTLNATLAADLEQERAGRRAEHPATREMLDAAARMTPLLWTRRPEHERFLDLRLGLGPQPSRTAVEMQRADGCVPQLWLELQAVVDRHRFVTDVPVVARLPETGALGIAGRRETALPVAYGIVAQLTALHSPSELVLCSVMSSASASDWSWLIWLPHTTGHPDSAHTPLRTPALTAGGAASIALVGELDALISLRASLGSSAGSAAPLPAVVLLVADDADIDRRRLVDLAERGPAQGIYVIWVASSVARLPAVCRTFLEIADSGGAAAGYVHRGEAVQPVAVEPVTSFEAMRYARGLAPVVDAGAWIDEDSQLPRSVSFLELAEAPVDRSVDSVVSRWQESGSLVSGPLGMVPGRDHLVSLRALVGRGSGGEPVHLDLRSHGPHALVGGTTGAGKSELLQSWILGMATTVSPQRITFLFVDYKGGAAFGACDRLPHSVGLVTDLDVHLVHRVLKSLRAELRLREELLDFHKLVDLDRLEMSKPGEAPPRLIIVVDEFAALKKEIPEFVDGLVDIAQRGRSLGLHLILATQRPTGVISDNLRANTNLRVALRMADEDDSTDVLGTAVAAGFDAAIPGRAVARIGPGRLVTFQTAYAGGWTSTAAARPELILQTLGFGPGRILADPAPSATATSSDRNDVTRIVETIGQAASLALVAKPRQPWLPALPAELELSYLLRSGLSELAELARLASRDDQRRLSSPAVVFGRTDRPDWQSQPPAAFYPDYDGSLLVVGTGGTGKSTALRTLALSAVWAEPQHTQIYGIEFGGLGLRALEPLPQVGEVIRGEDAERVTRLLKWLRGIVDRRAKLLAESDATTLTDLRRRVDTGEHPRILLLLDGIAAFTGLYPAGGFAGVFEDLVALANEGRAAGVHLVLSADRPTAVPSVLNSALQRRIVLRLANDNDYGSLGLRPDVLSPQSPPGRGRYGPEEVQIAVYGGAAPEEHGPAIESLARAFADVDRARPVPVLATRIRLADLDATVDGEPTYGVAGDTLGELAFRPSGAFLITGPAESGRTTTMRTMAAALRGVRPTMALIHVAARQSALTEQVRYDRAIRFGEGAYREDFAMVAKHAATQPVAIFVEAAEDFGGMPDNDLMAMLRTVVDSRGLVVVESDAATAMRSNALLELARSRRAGLLLQPHPNYSSVFGADLPRGIRQGDFPPGRGLAFRQSHWTIVHIAQTG